MKTLLNIIRWIVGLLFIFSGLIKANDPLGLSYKMQEFFEAWGWQGLHHYTLALSVLMNVFEVLAGVAVILGWRMRLFSWLLLLLIVFFSFLTGYALLSGKIKTCGCFGDCLPLTPLQSFLKDLFLLVLILVLFAKRNSIRPSLKPPVPGILLLVVVIATGYMQQYVLGHLPFVDCLPYKKGSNILKKMEPPQGAVIDSFAITFKYRKNGKIVEFDAAAIPADLDSTYEYVDRYDKLVRKGNAIPEIEDFALVTATGYDTTQDVLKQKGSYIMAFIQNFDHWDQAAGAFGRLLDKAQSAGMPVIVATPAAADAAKKIIPAPSVQLRIVTCDATVVKTAARVVPTFFLMNGALIVEKKSYRDIASFISALPGK